MSDEDLLIELSKHKNWELDFGEIDNDPSDCCWRVHQRNGGYNDREWTLIGFGETPALALLDAINGS